MPFAPFPVEKYKQAFQSIKGGVWDLNLKNNTIVFSPEWKEMIGLTPQTPLFHLSDWLHRIHSEDVRTLSFNIDAVIKGDYDYFSCEYRILDGNATYHWMLCRAQVIKNKKNQRTNLIGIQLNIDEQKKREESLSYNALHDSLTGLANRSLFLELLGKSFSRYQRNHKQRTAVFFFDLDKLKKTNDTLGHAAGDELLKAIPDRIRKCCRDSDVLARLGGDEFSLLVQDLKSKESIKKLGDRILKEVTKPFVIKGQRLIPSLSIGVALSTPAQERSEDLLKEADIALYEAKTLGGNQLVIFSPTMKNYPSLPFHHEIPLDESLFNKQIESFFQPIFDLKSLKIKGFEALLRWNHPRYGPISPASFLPLAEESDLIIDLGDFIIEKSIAQLQAWRKAYPAYDLFMTINIALKQFKQPTFLQKLEGVTKAYKVSPEKIYLEFEEPVFSHLLNSHPMLLHELRKKGYGLILDDYGLAGAKLTNLLQPLFSIIKIDRSLVTNITHNKKAQTLLEAIFTITKKKKLRMILEGIETRKDLLFFQSFHRGYGQGFLFSEPKPALLIEKLLARGKVKH
jgi:diguanylate cyclase (GGDEF)-like protein